MHTWISICMEISEQVPNYLPEFPETMANKRNSVLIAYSSVLCTYITSLFTGGTVSCYLMLPALTQLIQDKSSRTLSAPAKFSRIVFSWTIWRNCSMMRMMMMISSPVVLPIPPTDHSNDNTIIVIQLKLKLCVCIHFIDHFVVSIKSHSKVPSKQL